MATKPNLLHSIGDALRNEDPELQRIAEENKLGRIENPGEIVLERVQQLGNFLNEKFGWRRRNPDGTPISQERKEKQDDTIKFLGDMLPRDPVEGMAGGFIRPLTAPIRTIFKATRAQKAASKGAGGAVAKIHSGMEEDIVGGLGSPSRKSLYLDKKSEAPFKMSDTSYDYGEKIEYSYSKNFLKMIRAINRKFGSMDAKNIKIENLKLWDNINPKVAKSQGWAKIDKKNKEVLERFGDDVDEGQFVSFKKQFKGAQKGNLDFDMTISSNPEVPNIFNVKLQHKVPASWAPEETMNGLAYLDYTVEKLAKPTSFGAKYKVSNFMFFTREKSGTAGKKAAARLSMQFSDQIPNNAYFEEGSLTMDSLYFLLRNAYKGAKGKKIIARKSESLLDRNISAKADVRHRQQWSKLSEAADKGDKDAMWKIIKTAEANLIKKGKLKGKLDKSGNVISSDLDLKIIQHPFETKKELVVEWNMFQIRHLKMMIATLSGYSSFEAYKRSLNKKTKPSA